MIFKSILAQGNPTVWKVAAATRGSVLQGSNSRVQEEGGRANPRRTESSEQSYAHRWAKRAHGTPLRAQAGTVRPFRAVAHNNRIHATMVLRGASQLPQHCVSTGT